MPARRALAARSSAGLRAPFLGRASPLCRQRLLAARRRRPGPGAPRGASRGLPGSEPSAGEKGLGGGRHGRRGLGAAGGTPRHRGGCWCAPVPGEKHGDRRGPGETVVEEDSLVSGTRYGSAGGAAEELRQQLTRKQWRNHQKNKRRQKNKFKTVVGLGSREPSNSRPLASSVAEDPPDDQGDLVSDTETSGKQTPSLRQCPARQEPSCSKALASSAVEEPSDDQGGLVPDTEAPGRQTPSLRQRLESRLDAARFRYINQQLYTRSSQEAARLFQEDPEALAVYHRGFALQAARWPERPVERFVRYLRHRPASLIVADFGCGDCTLARSLSNRVHCFDLVALDPRVTICDMAQVPLEGASVDVAVFCLALMGTNLREILQEAHRVLRAGGTLLVAEVASRFADVRAFLGALARLGFRLVSKDLSGSHFYAFELRKAERAAAAEEQPRGLALRPCLYKRR